MMRETDENPARTIAVAVATAALTTLATGLVTWALEEAKSRRARAERETNEGSR